MRRQLTIITNNPIVTIVDLLEWSSCFRVNEEEEDQEAERAKEGDEGQLHRGEEVCGGGFIVGRFRGNARGCLSFR